MFICKDCAKDRLTEEGWKASIATSLGPCEFCKETNACKDVPSSADWAWIPKPEPELPAVAGEFEGTPEEFERSCLVLLMDEQGLCAPNNALVGVLCQAVRLVRLNVRMAGLRDTMRTPQCGASLHPRDGLSYRCAERKGHNGTHLFGLESRTGWDVRE